MGKKLLRFKVRYDTWDGWKWKWRTVEEIVLALNEQGACECVLAAKDHSLREFPWHKVRGSSVSAWPVS